MCDICALAIEKLSKLWRHQTYPIRNYFRMSASNVKPKASSDEVALGILEDIGIAPDKQEIHGSINIFQAAETGWLLLGYTHQQYLSQIYQFIPGCWNIYSLSSPAPAHNPIPPFGTASLAITISKFLYTKANIYSESIKVLACSLSMISLRENKPRL